MRLAKHIAKVLGDVAVATATQIGTPLFCAPEQLGASMRKVAAMRDFTIEVGVSPATDVWAAALIVYQMLTGYPPTQYWRVDEMAALIAKIALDEREPPSICAGERALHLPHGFDEWYLRCLRHAASERYQQIGEAMSALSLLLDNDPSEAAERAAAANGEKGRETLRIAVPCISEGGSRKSPREASEDDDDVPLAADDAPLAVSSPQAMADSGGYPASSQQVTADSGGHPAADEATVAVAALIVFFPRWCHPGSSIRTQAPAWLEANTTP